MSEADNKTSDKNVANIEVIEDFILELKDFELNKNTLEVANALEDILAEREQDKKRIQELEADLYSSNEIIADLTDSIPKQVVIDKIKEYDKKMEEDAGHPNWVVTDRIVMNVLQELLEGGRK